MCFSKRNILPSLQLKSLLSVSYFWANQKQTLSLSWRRIIWWPLRAKLENVCGPTKTEQHKSVRFTSRWFSPTSLSPPTMRRLILPLCLVFLLEASETWCPVKTTTMKIQTIYGVFLFRQQEPNVVLIFKLSVRLSAKCWYNANIMRHDGVQLWFSVGKKNKQNGRIVPEPWFI